MKLRKDVVDKMSVYSFSNENKNDIFGKKDMSEFYFNIILDGMNVFITNFHKMYGILCNSSNVDSGGLYVSLKDIYYIIREFYPYINKSLFNIVFEHGKSDEHINVDEDYKQNRDVNKILEDKYDTIEEVEAEKFNFRNQLNAFKTITSSIPIINHIQVSKTEGDFAIRFIIDEYERILNEKYGIDKSKIIHIIFSNDSDFLQLLELPNIIIYNLRLKTYIYKQNINKYCNQFKRPLDSLLYKIICGDPTDNIKGVRGIGKKTFEKIRDILFGTLTIDFSISDLKRVLETFSNRKEIKKIVDYAIYPDIIEQNYKLVNILNYDNVIQMINLNILEYLKTNVDSYIDMRISNSFNSSSIPILMLLGEFDILSMLDGDILEVLTKNHSLYIIGG